MSDIRVIKSPEESELDKLGVKSWVSGPKKLLSFHGVTTAPRRATFSKVRWW